VRAELEASALPHVDPLERPLLRRGEGLRQDHQRQPRGQCPAAHGVVVQVAGAHVPAAAEEEQIDVGPHGGLPRPPADAELREQLRHRELDEFVAHVADRLDVAHPPADQRLEHRCERSDVEQPPGGRAAGGRRPLGGEGTPGCAACDQPVDGRGRAAGEAVGEQVAVEGRDDRVDRGQGVDRRLQTTTALEARKPPQLTAEVEGQHRAHALLAAAAVHPVAHVPPADPQVTLHERRRRDRADLLEPRRLRRHVLDLDPGGAVQPVRRRAGPHLGILAAQPVGGDQQPGDDRGEEVAGGRERPAERPQPRRRAVERMPPQVGADDHGPCARLGGDLAEQPRDRRGPASLAEFHVVADDVREHVDSPPGRQERVEGVDAAAEAERRARAVRTGATRRQRVRTRRVGIPEVPKRRDEPRQAGGPGVAHARPHREQPAGVHGRHEKSRGERLRSGLEPHVVGFEPHAPAGDVGRDTPALPAGGRHLDVTTSRDRPVVEGPHRVTPRCAGVPGTPPAERAEPRGRRRRV